MKSRFLILLSPLLGGTIGLADAAVSIATEQVIGQGLVVSGTDLLQTSLASSTGAQGLLTDGLFGPVGTASTAASHQSIANLTVEFSFDLTASPSGYSIQRIETFAGWDEGRDGQQYSVLYSQASAPATFLPLIDAGPFPAGSQFGGANSSTRLSIFESGGGPLLTEVARLRFTFGSFENSGTYYREIDVIGVPEPAGSALILGSAVMGLAVFRRRRFWSGSVSREC